MADKVKILVVDDEQIVLDSIRRHLRSETDYQLYLALSVSKAMEKMEKEKADIILTDLMMPDIDGLEFIRMVKKKYPNTLMIMITGYATINTALQAMQVGAMDYIAKPFTREELKSVVARAAKLVGVQNGHSKEGNAPKDEKEKLKGIGQHSWLMKIEDDSILIGVERPFIISLGRIQSVYLPEKGDEIRQGSTYFQVFCADLRSDSLLSPLSGTVVETNKLVIENPDKALQDPYEKGWLLKLKASNFEEERKILGL